VPDRGRRHARRAARARAGRANRDVVRGSRDFTTPRSAPGLGVRDLGKARDLGMRLGGPGHRGRRSSGAARAGARRRVLAPNCFTVPLFDRAFLPILQ
jgi:hypothetical protein